MFNTSFVLKTNCFNGLLVINIFVYLALIYGFPHMNLNYYQERKEGMLMAFVCSKCGMTFMAQSALLTHMNTHRSSSDTTKKTMVTQTSTTEESTITVNSQVEILNTSGGDLKIVNCIPKQSSITKIEDLVSFDKLTNTLQDRKPTVPSSDSSNGKAVLQQNPSLYPPVNSVDSSGRYKYNYEVEIQSNILDEIKKIKQEMNIPSAYSRLELNKLFHEKFNRFRIEYPDYFMNGTLAYVVMTRPDLNIFKSDDDLSYSNLQQQVLNDPQLYYIMNADLETARTLTKAYSSKHHFNPLLSNTLTSLDISDESIDTLETGETFTGFKTQYAKSNIRSMTAGTINLKFPETYNMAITHAHQLWCTYESCVYRGSMEPKEKYIWNKELDYAVDIYYFLLDKEDLILRYWCKYTGCFPLNVNKSVFSYDVGSELSHPEMSVTYAYFAREDMSSMTINEFNNNAGGRSVGFKYVPPYYPKTGLSGNTWVNAPFVHQVTVPTGMDRDAKLYALKFRK